MHVCYECNKCTIIVNIKKEKYIYIYIINDALSDTLVYKNKNCVNTRQKICQ